MQDTIARWLADGETFVAVYENRALDSSSLGQRIGMPFAMTDFDKVSVGDRAPDTAKVIGWKYQCVGKAKTVEAAMALLQGEG